MSGAISVISLGPGDPGWIAPHAMLVLEACDAILGYNTYLDQIENIAPQTPRYRSVMRKELERTAQAVRLAQEGKHVALVSGGDAGIYAMAGPLFETLEAGRETGIVVEVFPGISALNAAAALLGAPLMNDFAAISLSDLLTPLEIIKKRLDLAAQADFVICLYNPCSRTRQEPFKAALNILLQHRPAATPVGLVHAAYRPQQKVEILPLGEIQPAAIGMDTILIVGSSCTHTWNGKMITARGYPFGEQK